MIEAPEFVEWFRSSAPYIHAHRGKTFVIVFGGEVIDSPGLRALVQDVALLYGLGVKLVLVVGARPQIEDRLAKAGRKSVIINDIRVTDETAMRFVKEAAATNRVELESLLSMGLPSSPMAGARIRVATGNFVSARPIGVIEGVDFGFTGEVRRVEGDAIRNLLDDNFVVILSPIGYSITGEAFNASTPEVAASAAIALKADKLICLVEGKGLVDGRGRIATELDPAAAEAWLKSKKPIARENRRYLAASARAVRHGVRRAHLVSRKVDGGILRELFTRDGIGTLVSGEAFEGVRVARPGDVAGLLELLEPLEEAGILVRRPREILERDIKQFIVTERDGLVVGCAALYPYEAESMAELACVAVRPEYRGHGRAEVMLQYAERLCRERGIERLFVLTTQTAHWFVEQGFANAHPKVLPAAKRALYDKRRRSKVLVKLVENVGPER